MPSLDPPGGVIPETPAELTPTWLAAILTRHGFSAAVQSIELRPVAGALTSEVLRVIPRMQDETTGFAPPLVWKRSLDDATQRKPLKASYAAEVNFYRDVAPTLGVSVPRCFVAAYDDKSGAHALLLEDLAPGSAGDLQAGVSILEAESVVRELARLHAHRWRPIGPQHPPESFSDAPGLIERWASVGATFLEQHLDSNVTERTSRYVANVADQLSSLSAGPETFVHGDPHPANVIFPTVEGRRPHLIDWQGSGSGAALRDISRFLVLGLSPDERRTHEDGLLDVYVEELDSRGVKTDSAAIAQNYRTAAQLQWGWAVLFFRFESLWDSDIRATFPVLAQRAAAAFDDLSR